MLAELQVIRNDHESSTLDEGTETRKDAAMGLTSTTDADIGVRLVGANRYGTIA
jgi:hypothetical protein